MLFKLLDFSNKIKFTNVRQHCKPISIHYRRCNDIKWVKINKQCKYVFFNGSGCRGENVVYYTTKYVPAIHTLYIYFWYFDLFQEEPEVAWSEITVGIIRNDHDSRSPGLSAKRLGRLTQSLLPSLRKGRGSWRTATPPRQPWLTCSNKDRLKPGCLAHAQNPPWLDHKSWRKERKLEDSQVPPVSEI